MRAAVRQILRGFAWRGEETARAAPHVRTTLNSNQCMMTALVAALPALGAALYVGGPRVLLMLLVAYVCIGVVEVAFATFREQQVDVGTVVTGLLLVLTLPAGTPLWLLALGALFGMFFGKAIFGGTGHNILNPALLGRCFIVLGYPTLISDFLASIKGATGEGLPAPLTLAFSDAGYWILIPIILGGAFLLVTRVASWRVVISIVLSGAALSTVLWRVGAGGEANQALLLIPCSAGFLFGAVFLATDPVTSPNTAAGQWIYGILVGVLAVVITLLATYGEGMMFAILLGNLVTPTIDAGVLSLKFRGYGL